MFRPIALDHLVLRVVDLRRMLHFYCEVLGCTLQRRQDDIGLVQVRAGSALIDLVPVDGALGRAGGAAVERRYGAEGEGPSIYLSDPEGNTVELKGPPDRDGS